MDHPELLTSVPMTYIFTEEGVKKVRPAVPLVLTAILRERFTGRVATPCRGNGNTLVEVLG